MSSCYIKKKNERIISIFENCMTEFHERPEQPSYYIKHFKTLANLFSWADRFVSYLVVYLRR